MREIRDSMKVAVLIKQVPDTTAKVGITSGSVDERGCSFAATSPCKHLMGRAPDRWKSARGAW